MFPSTNDVSLKPQIYDLLKSKVTHFGKPLDQNPVFLEQVIVFFCDKLKADPLFDQNNSMGSLHKWLLAIQTYEADDATRKQIQIAPASPFSTQSAPQVAKLAPTAVDPIKEEKHAELSAEKPYLDPRDGTAYETLRGLKSHVTRAHKDISSWSQFCATYGLDADTGVKAGQKPPEPIAANPPVAPPVSPNIVPMFGQQTIPVQQAVPMFAPARADMPSPAPVQSPDVPVYTGNRTGGESAKYNTDNTNYVEATAQTPASDRVEIAKMLGGSVDILILRMLDASTVSLSGRTDLNQLVAMAEQNAKNEMAIRDLAQGAYGAGKQAAQRHFGLLLTQYPKTYLLLNGYEMIIPADYFHIACARITKAVLISEQGRTATSLNL